MNFVSIKKRASLFFFFLAIIIPCSVFSQDTVTGAELPVTDAPLAENEISPQEKNNGKNINIDAELMYGQYNNILSTLSLIQSTDSFTYQLNTDFTRSNDFGYDNSSFYESEVGFSGKGQITKNWSIIPQLDIYNESHGMFGNSFYNREEKDKIVLLLKNEYKPTPSRWQVNFGGGQYVHRLMGADPYDMSFYKLNEEIEWEYVWSSSYQWSFRHYSSHYFYKNTTNDDYHVGNEILGSFKIMEYIKISAGGIMDWNRDAGFFPSGKAQIASVGLKYFILEGAYIYDLVPFMPEDLYFDQKFIYPNNNLPPGKVHKGDVKGSFELSKKSKSDIYIKKIKIKCRGLFEDNNNFYNYNFGLLPGNVLSAETVHAHSLGMENEAAIDVAMFAYEVGFLFSYRFDRYYADDNITYRPEHRFNGGVTFTSEKWALEWSNEYNSSMYVYPGSSEKLGDFIVGMLELRIQMVDSLFFNIKLNNLYNMNYCYIPGYAEPGFTVLAGLRIII
ncbi:MAG: hypothetical protein CVV44_13455 [Spirochaetae bacterium HGW-Spirochaetae-1]|jgi:hypothetical protein|nr:MAG: hypothetical protein CVV44_13455 [Spirochaetae bacterium HGW-Spirochaetae-1]